MSRLLVLAPGELTRDPRARRAATAARAAGYDVVGVCSSRAGEPPVPLEGIEVVRVGGGGVSAGLRSAGLGGMKRSRPVARELRGLFRIVRLAAATVRLARAARRFGAVEVVHAGDFETLPAGWLVARRLGARIVYDAHELYADQEPATPLVYRGLIRALEGPLARRANAVVTVSEPIAEELQRSLRLRSLPFVVLNCPPRAKAEPAPRGNGPLRAIYQGAMGPGRLLEDLLVAAESAEGVLLTVRVVNTDLQDLRRELLGRRLGGRVEIAEPVPPERLVEALAGFHVGLVINRPLTRNDELVLPNKLFEYLMAGLAVAVPRLPGIAPLVEAEGVGVIYEPGDPQALGAALTRLAREPETLDVLRIRARSAALERFNADVQSPVLAAAWRSG